MNAHYLLTYILTYLPLSAICTEFFFTTKCVSLSQYHRSVWKLTFLLLWVKRLWQITGQLVNTVKERGPVKSTILYTSICNIH